MDADELAIKEREYKLEKWKVFLSILTPLVLVALTFVVNDAIQERGAKLKRDEQILGEKQKIYAELGRRLNVFYVYVADVGDFRSYTPPRVVEMKREADRQFFMYRPYWSKVISGNQDPEQLPQRLVILAMSPACRHDSWYGFLRKSPKVTEDRYNEYMGAVFLTYTGAGLPAQINASRSQKVAAYEVDKLKWEPSWDRYFTEKADTNISAKYYALVSSLLADTVNADIRKIAP